MQGPLVLAFPHSVGVEVRTAFDQHKLLAPRGFVEEFAAQVGGDGGVADGDTILWWLKQSKEARAAICTNDALNIKDALFELSHFITCHACNLKKLKVRIIKDDLVSMENQIIRHDTLKLAFYIFSTLIKE